MNNTNEKNINKTNEKYYWTIPTHAYLVYAICSKHLWYARVKSQCIF